MGRGPPLPRPRHPRQVPPHPHPRHREGGDHRHRPRAQRLTEINSRRITDRYTTSRGLTGRARLMWISILCAAVSLGLFALPTPTPAMFVVAAALGVGLGVGQPLTMSWFSEQVEPDQRGTTLAVRLAGNRLSQLTIPSVVGGVAVATGSGIVLVTTGLIVGATSSHPRRAAGRRRSTVQRVTLHRDVRLPWPGLTRRSRIAPHTWTPGGHKLRRTRALPLIVAERYETRAQRALR
ncbi:MFS transporter [Microbacterium aurum]